MVEDYTKEDRELLKDRKMMQDLLASAAWKRYAEIVASQIKTRENIILSTPAAASAHTDALGRLLEIEQVKGALIGLKLAIQTPTQIIDDATALVAQGKGDD